MKCQSHILIMSGITLVSISFTSLTLVEELMSSADIAIWPFSTWLRRSFIKVMKSNGPKIEPCGTPDFITLKLDV